MRFIGDLATPKLGKFVLALWSLDAKSLLDQEHKLYSKEAFC